MAPEKQTGEVLSLYRPSFQKQHRMWDLCFLPTRKAPFPIGIDSERFIRALNPRDRDLCYWTEAAASPVTYSSKSPPDLMIAPSGELELQRERKPKSGSGSGWQVEIKERVKCGGLFSGFMITSFSSSSPNWISSSTEDNVAKKAPAGRAKRRE